MFQHINLEAVLIDLIVIVCSITLHEFGHALSADRLGDPGPRMAGRVNIWPDRHFDPIGFVMIVITVIAGFGLGWGKPVMVNPRCFRNPQRDMIIVAICGPVMNLLLAVVFGLCIRVIIALGHLQWLYTLTGRNSVETTTLGLFLEAFLSINLSLMFFNLIPVPPLDGSKVLMGLLPAGTSMRYERFMGMYGAFILIALLVSGGVSRILGPAVDQAAALLTGTPFG